MAVMWITDQETGSVLHVVELCTKTGERVMEVLRTKNSDARPQTMASLDTYPERPLDLFPM